MLEGSAKAPWEDSDDSDSDSDSDEDKDDKESVNEADIKEFDQAIPPLSYVLTLEESLKIPTGSSWTISRATRSRTPKIRRRWR